MDEFSKDKINEDLSKIDTASKLYNEIRRREMEVEEAKKELSIQKDEMYEYRDKIEQEYMLKNKSLAEQKSLFNKEIASREARFHAEQKKLETNFSERLSEVEQARGILEKEYQIKQSHLNELIRETEKEKERYREESRKSIESKTEKFVQSALDLLGDKENRFHDISKYWAVIGVASIIFSIVFAIWVTIDSANAYHSANNSSIAYYVYSLLRGLIVVSLFGLLARYAFLISNSYMHESLKSGERLHAIKFGEFYLDAYGADAEWDQLKEAFENWNISGVSAFSRKENAQSTDYTDLVVSTINKGMNSIGSKSD